MKQICSVGADYLGLSWDECRFSFDYKCISCAYYNQKEDDLDHPTELPRVCGNCIHWMVLEEAK